MIDRALYHPMAFALALLVAAGSRGMAADRVDLHLTFPNGASPKVFTTGWTFGARATLNPGTTGAKDLSKQVTWSGSGVFQPAVGPVSHPAFAGAGANYIDLTVVVGTDKHTKRFPIQAVTPNHAVVGWTAACGADVHGCPGCPHPARGHIKTGNPKVKINGKPVACVGDKGTHDLMPCCGSGQFTIVDGDPSVRVDGRPVARVGSQTRHCGGMGTVGGAAVKRPVTRTTYRGTFSGGATGSASFTITPGKGITGTLIGRHTTEGGGPVRMKLEGSYELETAPIQYRQRGLPVEPSMILGTADGKMTGTTTYTGFEGKRATAKVTGKFKGLVRQNGTFNGKWSAMAYGILDVGAGGHFKAKLVSK